MEKVRFGKSQIWLKWNLGNMGFWKIAIYGKKDFGIVGFWECKILVNRYFGKHVFWEIHQGIRIFCINYTTLLVFIRRQ